MSYLALYRKYRPTNFSDMVGQKEIIEVLKKEIIQNRISHAYLFAGPRGTGKTSTAKIMARMVNCEKLGEDGVPCGTCDFCKNFNANSDIVEIDAASNNGVDEIRNLRDKVNLVPTSCKYKIYIIDEVHMLTTQAFNALLKTLEEPPSHVIFILATTEFYKIPITVVSRCQKFQFSKVSNEEIVLRLKDVAVAEKIDVDDSCLYEIARLSDGGLRDAINMLDQLSSYSDNKISLDDVYKLSGTFSRDELFVLINDIYNNNYSSLIEFSEKVNSEGKNITKFIEEVVGYLRNVIYYKVTGKFFEYEDDKIKELCELGSINDFYSLIYNFNELLNNLKNTSIPYILLSISLIKISNEIKDDTEILKSENVVENEKKVDEITKKMDNILVEKKEISFKKFDESLRRLRIDNTFATASKEKLINMKNDWGKIEDLLLDDKYGSSAGLLKDVELIVAGDKNIMLLSKYNSLTERLYDNINDIEDLVNYIFNDNFKVVFLDVDEWNYEKKKYIDNLKNGYKYTYKIEKEDKKLDNKKNNDEDLKKVVDILGNEMIEYI